MNASPKPGVLAVMDAEIEELAFHPADTARFNAMREARATVERLVDAVANMPDDADMIEHNPDEGMRLFCCGGDINDGYRGIAGVTHAAGCWFAEARTALAPFKGES